MIGSIRSQKKFIPLKTESWLRPCKEAERRKGRKAIVAGIEKVWKTERGASRVRRERKIVVTVITGTVSFNYYQL